jgi:hypothetical protein
LQDAQSGIEQAPSEQHPMLQQLVLIEHEALECANVEGAEASASTETTEATARVISLRFIWIFSHSHNGTDRASVRLGSNPQHDD